MASLEDHWHAAWRELGLAAPPDERLAELAAHYGEPHRAYHTAGHVLECLEEAAAARELAERPGEVALALLYHDVIYDTRRSDNEALSAALAVEVLRAAGAPGDVCERVRDLILATRHVDPPETVDAALVVDADLASLGAEPEVFVRNGAAIRHEYGWVPEADFNAGRARFLRAVLARPAIYATERFRARLEARARANLRAALVRFEAGGA